MRANDRTEVPNPFAIEPNSSGRPARKAHWSALKLFALVAATLAVTVVISAQSRRWLLTRLTSDFETLSSSEKRERLTQIAELGAPATKTLVHSLADQDIDVARTAHDLLRQSQNDWTVLDDDDSHRRHLAMVNAMNAVAVQLPDDRTGWATGLLQQTILETVDRSDEPSRDLYSQATDTLARFSLSERAGPSILAKQSISDRPIRLTVRSQPLPAANADAVSSAANVSAAESIEHWTDWPPPLGSTPDSNTRSASSDDLSRASLEESDAEGPSVFRSSTMRLQPVASRETVNLHDMEARQETSFQSAEILPAAHLVDSPLETYDTKSVVFWLGSQHPALREKAERELLRRGLTQQQLSIARKIASGDVQTRLQLVDSIARSDHIDPRPWLLMLLNDQSRDVQLRVVSVLATMNDPHVRDQLRQRLVDAHDPTVAARIRRVLDLR